jgi:hypothetical protein
LCFCLKNVQSKIKSKKKSLLERASLVALENNTFEEFIAFWGKAQLGKRINFAFEINLKLKDR